jgi:S-adenosylmethionine synthetase
MSNYLWTSEAVSAGHPDKVADQLADAILDAHLAQDPQSRVACEIVVTRDPDGDDMVLVTGEITSQAKVNLEDVIRETLLEIGYDRRANGFDGHRCKIRFLNREQSTEIAGAVSKDCGDLGAGDQGLMFGYACDETPTLMPLAHYLSFDIIRLIEEDIAAGRTTAAEPWNSIFLPDAKSQVTLEYSDNGTPQRVHSVVVSACHRSDVSLDEVKAKLTEFIPRIGEKAAGFSQAISNLFDENTVYHFNPAGEWNLGGPAADTGLSGRKIVVDNYGADCPIGGGSFSGKDPTKVDRSAAYAARHVAKNIVAGGYAKRARVQLAYAIGVTDPMSLRVQTFGIKSVDTLGTGTYSDADLTEMVQQTVPMTPSQIIERLNLRTPIYRRTASGGHFGREGFTWEALDLVEKFNEYMSARCDNAHPKS